MVLNYFGTLSVVAVERSYKAGELCDPDDETKKVPFYFIPPPANGIGSVGHAPAWAVKPVPSGAEEKSHKEGAVEPLVLTVFKDTFKYKFTYERLAAEQVDGDDTEQEEIDVEG